MVKKEKKYKIVSSVLIRRFEYLGILKYNINHDNIEVIYPNIELLGIAFANSTRKITFSYTERNIRDEVFDNFNISISKDEYHSFDFVSYLNTIGIKNPEEKMKLINYSGDFKERVEKFCEFVKGIFEKHLHKVISGEEWINVSFDWGPYK